MNNKDRAGFFGERPLPTFEVDSSSAAPSHPARPSVVWSWHGGGAGGAGPPATKTLAAGVRRR